MGEDAAKVGVATAELLYHLGKLGLDPDGIHRLHAVREARDAAGVGPVHVNRLRRRQERADQHAGRVGPEQDQQPPQVDVFDGHKLPRQLLRFRGAATRTGAPLGCARKKRQRRPIIPQVLPCLQRGFVGRGEVLMQWRPLMRETLLDEDDHHACDRNQRRVQAKTLQGL